MDKTLIMLLRGQQSLTRPPNIRYEKGHQICEARKIPWSDLRRADELYSPPEDNAREDEYDCGSDEEGITS